MKDFFELTPDEIKEIVLEQGGKSYHASQIIDWVYIKGVTDWEKMTNLSKDFRQKFSTLFKLNTLELVKVQESEDKETFKFLWKLRDGKLIESVLICDPQNGQVIGTTGYRPGGGKSYAEHLLKYVNDYSGYKQKMGYLDQGNFTGSDLKQLYEQANQLHISSDAEKIVNAGVDSDKSLYFLTQRYEQLAHEGKIHTQEAQTLRGQLLTSDPSNEYGIPYQVALIDFETYLGEMSTESCSAELAVSPLNAYLERFGSKDKENAWRLEMIISQVYLDTNQMPEALKHAEHAFDAAPVNAQAEISKAIKSIQSQLGSISLLSTKH